MNTATIAMALTVLREGSIRGAARLTGRSASTVADAFGRFERDLAMTLGERSEGHFSLTVSGQALASSSRRLLDCLLSFAEISGSKKTGALEWACGHPLAINGLSNFLAVVQAGSIRKASRSLGLAQPHLSRQISRLETILGCSLLKRGSAGSEPSSQGQQLGVAATTLTNQLSQWTATAERRFARAQHIVRLGTVIPIGHESRLAFRLAQLLVDWRRDFGHQDLLVSSATAEDLIAGLRGGKFDIALMDMPLLDRRFQSREVFSSELVLVFGKEAPAGAVSLDAALRGRQIAVPSLRSGLRQRIREVLYPLLDGSNNAESRSVEVDALSIIVNLIVEHGFISILPLDAVRSLRGDVRMISLPDAPRIGFHLVWPDRPSASAVAGRVEKFLTGRDRAYPR